jgi:2-oxoglutarate/2-oxoacid ferredoxin oxidoreductase subunit alpha
MAKDIFTYLVGGKAGEGVKKAGQAVARLFSDMGRRTIEYDDYMSLIKGGHNFSIISTSVREITSHYLKADLVVALDQRSLDMHIDHVAKDGILVFNSDAVKAKDGPDILGLPLTEEAKKYPEPALRIGLAGPSVLAAVIGLEKSSLKTLIEKEYGRGIKENLAYGEAVYELAKTKIGVRFELEPAISDKSRPIITGNEAISLGAAAAGLDLFFAYPMTPTSSILHYLAVKSKELGIAVIHPENEIAVMNMAVGAAAMGARTMVASSGGGFALMEEAISLAGMTETPVLCVLGSRPGPSTGVPTYTEQGDLRFALNQGHGEFSRIVASPGSIEEAFYLSGELLGLAWRFQTPTILLTEKHLCEGAMTVDIDVGKVRFAEGLMHKESKGTFKRYLDTKDGVSPMLFPPSKELIKYDSYEHDELGITTEDPKIIVKMHDKRRRKGESIVSHLRKMHTVNIFGEGKNKGPVVFTYGSTTLSVLEAFRYSELQGTVVQPIYLEPFPVWELAKYKDRKIIVVEQSSTGTFANLLKEKAGIEGTWALRRYDGRPFEPTELASELKGVM